MQCQNFEVQREVHHHSAGGDKMLYNEDNGTARKGIGWYIGLVAPNQQSRLEKEKREGNNWTPI